MPLTKVAEGTAAKGQYTFAIAVAQANDPLVAIVREVPHDRPVPSFYWLDCFTDTFVAQELVVSAVLASGHRASYVSPSSGAESVYIYHELRSPLPDPLHWEIWRYT